MASRPLASRPESLLERGEDVCAVYCAPDKGRRIDPLKALAERGLPLFQPPSQGCGCARADAFAERRSVRYGIRYAAGAGQVLNAPELGSIQYHPSLLPLHKAKFHQLADYFRRN